MYLSALGVFYIMTYRRKAYVEIGPRIKMASQLRNPKYRNHPATEALIAINTVRIVMFQYASMCLV